MISKLVMAIQNANYTVGNVRSEGVAKGHLSGLNQSLDVRTAEDRYPCFVSFI
jgi:hypothetical protein